MLNLHTYAPIVCDRYIIHIHIRVMYLYTLGSSETARDAKLMKEFKTFFVKLYFALQTPI